MKRRFAVRRMGLVAGLSLLLAACGGGGDGGGSGTAGGSGTLRLALTDAPACGYDKVNVTIEKVRVHQSASASDSDAGWSEIVLSPAKRVDLLGLTNGVLAELGQTALPAGKYTQLRLVLADNGSAPLANSVVPTGGAEVALTTPSAQQSGLKLSTNIDVASNQLADFVIDFDANGSTTLSLQQAGVTVRSTPPDASGKFLLQPVAPGSYTLVLTAPGRTTLVVTGVTVAADTVSAINLAGATLSPPVSASATVSGTVTMATTPVDASVRALQALSGGPAIEIAARPVDSASGAYSLQLPTAAPLVAIYPTGVATLAFTPDASVAGMYSVQAAAGTSVKTVGPLTLTPGAAGTASFVFP
jgi:hypothetical protein